MDDNNKDGSGGEPFLSRYDAPELRVAAEFLTTWFPFLSADLCPGCARTLSNRIRSLVPGGDSDSKNSESSETTFAVTTPEIKAAHPNNAECSSSSGNAELHSVSSSQERQDTGCLGSFRDASFRSFRMALEASADPGARETQAVESPMPRASSDDTEGEAELEEEESQELDRELSVGDISLNRFANKRELSRKRREYLRFMDVKRNKELVFYERVKGRRVNILEGLELHDGLFDAAEQKRIVDFVYELQDMGRRGKLKGWYSLLCR